MFCNLRDNVPSYEIGLDYYVPVPKNFQANTQDLHEGLTKAIAAFTVVKTNCNNDCKEALDIKDTKVIEPKLEYSYNSCIRRCFVQRIKSHFPDNTEITDFLYASAFEYKQKDLFYLIVKDIEMKEKISNSNFKNIENVASAFNKYFV